MTTQSTKSGLFVGRVMSRTEPCQAHFQVTLELQGFSSAEPGQFMQIDCYPPRTPASLRDAAQNYDPGDFDTSQKQTERGSVLRRPFSIAGMRRRDHSCEVDFMGRVVGAGTEYLAVLSPGDLVDVLGPLGRGFNPPASHKRALLVAGGIGLPPIRWLGEKLTRLGVSCEAVYGAQTRALMPVTLAQEPPKDGALALCVEDFARDRIPTAITTDDGSCGLHGRVTDAMEKCLARSSDVSSYQAYACGPTPMLRAVAAFCADRGVDCELAMERTMGCGMGTCQSCVVKVLDQSCATGWRYALCCTEGPVFDAADVVWD